MANHAVLIDGENLQAARCTTNAPSTVGEYIEGVVVKEIWAVQLERNVIPFERDFATNFVAGMSPKLGAEVLATVRALIPAAEDIYPMHLLPDLDELPPNISEDDGWSMPHRKVGLEALKIFFDALNEGTPESSGSMDPPILPPASIASISGQLVAMLEHVSLVSRQGADIMLQQSDIDLQSWENVCSAADGQFPPGSKKELLATLQECRGRIFDLEREVVTQSKVSVASANRDKKEFDKSLARLTAVNQALEEKLKSRTSESRAAGQRILDLEQRLSHTQELLQERGAKIQALEAEIARIGRMQDDLLIRERRYGERMLELHVEEFMSVCRDRQRQKQIESTIRGEVSDDRNTDNFLEKDLSKLAEDTLEKVQAQFHGFFEERKQNMYDVVESHEAQIQKKLQSMEGFGKNLQRRLSGQADMRGPVDVAVQTDHVARSVSKHSHQDYSPGGARGSKHSCYDQASLRMADIAKRSSIGIIPLFASAVLCQRRRSLPVQLPDAMSRRMSVRDPPTRQQSAPAQPLSHLGLMQARLPLVGDAERKKYEGASPEPLDALLEGRGEDWREPSDEESLTSKEVDGTSSPRKWSTPSSVPAGAPDISLWKLSESMDVERAALQAWQRRSFSIVRSHGQTTLEYTSEQVNGQTQTLAVLCSTAEGERAEVSEMESITMGTLSEQGKIEVCSDLHQYQLAMGKVRSAVEEYAEDVPDVLYPLCIDWTHPVDGAQRSILAASSEADRAAWLNSLSEATAIEWEGAAVEQEVIPDSKSVQEPFAPATEEGAELNAQPIELLSPASKKVAEVRTPEPQAEHEVHLPTSPPTASALNRPLGPLSPLSSTQASTQASSTQVSTGIVQKSKTSSPQQPKSGRERGKSWHHAKTTRRSVLEFERGA